jgi:hypothetical protein
MTSSTAISIDDLPPEGADWREVEAWCATFDGYADGARSVDDLMAIARQVEADPRAASVDDLLASAYFHWRRARWNDQADAEDVRAISTVIEQLRRRLAN